MKSEISAPSYGRAAPDYVERHLHVLSDAELLGVLLAGGHVQEESTGLAQALLGALGGLSSLPGASGAMLRHGGLHDAQAAALLTACELASRLARQQIPRRRPLAQLDRLALYLMLRYQQRDQEVMGALFLDIRHGLLGDQEIFRGTLCRAEVEPREILKECLLRGAAGVVVFHTHPSGDPTPSDADLQFTRRMAYAATLVGVELVDHLVLGAIGFWVSLKERGGW
jgi:DNA repair protein RadC